MRVRESAARYNGLLVRVCVSVAGVDGSFEVPTREVFDVRECNVTIYLTGCCVGTGGDNWMSHGRDSQMLKIWRLFVIMRYCE